MGIWLGLTGFPKSLDVSKAIDKMAGAEREVVGKSERHNSYSSGSGHTVGYQVGVPDVTAPATEAAQQWQGWGTALKPAHEPICVARKPLSEKNVAQNVLKHGTGAINVDGCRVAGTTKHNNANGVFAHSGSGKEQAQHAMKNYTATYESTQGRWPPNLLLSHHPDCKPTGEVRRVKASTAGVNHEKPYGSERTWNTSSTPGRETTHHADPDGTEPQEVWECVEGCPIREMDRQSGQSKSTGGVTPRDRSSNGLNWANDDLRLTGNRGGLGDTGGASRFFPRFEAPFRYVAKSSRRDRTANGAVSNAHPTCKPTELMRWLCRLICPPGGVILDPFMGSGSTGVAAIREGFNFIGIEQDETYADTARKRIALESSERLEKSNGHTETPLETLF